jgi:hypothetical protein
VSAHSKAGALAAIWAASSPWSGAARADSASTAASSPLAIRCTNPYSHVSWTVSVDYRHRTVDGFPAQISRSEIRWDDTAHGGHYSLNRETGELTVLFASSTGGYALHDRCDLPREKNAAR